MRIAHRINKLGTETAFSVSQEANNLKAQGKTVYPFHLGDINIITPKNVIDTCNDAMNKGITGYTSNYGLTALRETLAEDINKSRGTSYTLDNVTIQPGGKPVIGKFIMALMNPGDEVLYPNPGYPIYESMIEFHGGTGLAYGYKEGKTNFEIDFDDLESKITDKTKILVYNNLHNPTGAESSDEEMERIAKLVVKHDLYVLCDEAYFDLRYHGDSKSLTSYPGMEERCVILYTFSKKFSMTGWRLGAAIAPKEISEVIAKLNLNDESCTNHFIQYAAIEAITGDQSGSKQIISSLKKRRDLCVEMLNAIDGVSCFSPNATFYLFPNVTGVMDRKGYTSYEDFRKDVLYNTGVSFCTRLHFGRAKADEKNKYIRFAYSGIDEKDIIEGLTKLQEFLK